MKENSTAQIQSRLLLPFILLTLCVLALLVSLVGLYRTSSVANARAAELSSSWQDVMQDGVQGSELLVTDRLVQSAALPFSAVESAALWSLSMAVLSVVLLAWLIWAARDDRIAQFKRIRKGADHDVAEAASLHDEIAPVLSGDLDVKASARSGTVGALADTINFAIGELRHRVSSQVATSRNLSSLFDTTHASTLSIESLCKTQAEQLATSSNHLSGISQSTAELSANALEAVTGSESVETSLIEFVESAALSRQKLTAVKADADNAQKLIQSVNDHARSVLHAVTLIDEFVEHTEHLAINATLQSSTERRRNDDSSSRLTELANEVSTLAEEFSRSVEDIGTLTRSVDTDTTNAMIYLRRLSKAVEAQLEQSELQSPVIDAIVTRTRYIKSNVEQIAKHGASHNQKVNTITTMLAGLNQSSQENLQTARQVNKSLGKLNTLAVKLRHEASDFSLPQREYQSDPTDDPVKSVARRAAERAVIDG